MCVCVSSKCVDLLFYFPVGLVKEGSLRRPRTLE